MLTKILPAEHRLRAETSISEEQTPPKPGVTKRIRLVSQERERNNANRSTSPGLASH